MHRDDAIGFEHQPLAGFIKHIRRADDLQLLGPEGSNEWRIKDRDMIHGDYIWLAIGNIFLPKNADIAQNMEDAAKDRFHKETNNPIVKRDSIQIAHFDKARTFSKT